MPKAQAIQINWQFTGSAGIMQVEHTADCFHFQWPWVTPRFQGHDVIFMPIDALSVSCAQLMHDLLAIAKFLLKQLKVGMIVTY